MAVFLAQNNYGKSRVRVMKVTRLPDRHDLAELSVGVQFEGDFDAVHLAGDNAHVLPTDTMKNTVNALAKTWSGEDIEEFGRELTAHFLSGNPQVSRVRVEINQCRWARLDRYAFERASEEKRTAQVNATCDSLAIGAGIDNLVILKTTGSGFAGYKKDRYTTLKETKDRILATAVRAEWSYTTPDLDFGACWKRVRAAMLKVFIERDSPSAQQTAYEMGAAALDAAPEIGQIRLSLPNKHCLLVDFAPFGMENANEVFTPTDEPHGLIEVTVARNG